MNSKPNTQEDSRKLRWGLVGCGDISQKRVAAALRDLPRSELVAVNRANFSALKEFAEEFGARNLHRHWHELIADPDVAAVYVATPVDLHSPITVAAAEAGKHVLCEKPMALSLDECDQMIRACQENDVQLGIAYYRFFYPVVKRIKEILASGEIGSPVLAQINAFEYFNPAPEEPRFWFVERKRAGGGPMFDFGCHRIGVLLDTLGEVGSVRGSLSNVRFEREVEDTGVAQLSFKNGSRATVTVTHAALEPQDTLSVFATQGSVHIPVLNEGHLRVVTREGERAEEHLCHSNLHWPLIENFIDAVLEGRTPAVDGTYGREVNRILDEIYRPQ